MYMSNEYRYLKSNLFNYYASHGTGVHCVDVQPARTKNTWAFGGVKFSPIKNWRFQGAQNFISAKKSGSHCPIFQSGP